MYFPKSQIKTNLYTKGGEFTDPSTGKNYIGSYFKTSTGEYYTGKNPQDFPVTNLQTTEAFETNNPISTSEPISETPSSIWTWDYYGTPLDKSLPPPPPTRIFPLPTEDDYTLGEFQRYFLSKTNEPKFIEINKEQYEKYANKEETVAYQLYQPLKLSWDLTGDRNNTYKVNEATVNRVEKISKSPGFKSYFKGKFDQFYK